MDERVLDFVGMAREQLAAPFESLDIWERFPRVERFKLSRAESQEPTMLGKDFQNGKLK